MQISLIQADPLVPLPTGSGHYVVSLQNRAGERDALRNASADAWARMIPLIQFVGPKDKGDLKAPTVQNWVRQVSTAVGTHPVYLDVVRLDPMARAETRTGSAPVLEVIYAAARKRKLSFMPVAQVGASPQAHRCVAVAAGADGHGVAIRYRLNRTLLPPETTEAQHLAALAEKLGVGPAAADILLDFGFIDPDQEVVVGDIAALIDDLVAIGSWRSIVLLGTSIPRTMGSVKEGTLASLPRREWKLWVELSELKELSRMPAYGDYAVQHPHPPHDGGGPGMRANVRYTAVQSTLVARGRGPVFQEGNEQYRQLCQELADSEEFCGRHYSWGDRVISDVALGTLRPSGQHMWRGAGTSHHLEFVTDQLRRHPRVAGTAASGSALSSDPSR